MSSDPARVAFLSCTVPHAFFVFDRRRCNADASDRSSIFWQAGCQSAFIERTDDDVWWTRTLTRAHIYRLSALIIVVIIGQLQSVAHFLRYYSNQSMIRDMPNNYAETADAWEIMQRRRQNVCYCPTHHAVSFAVQLKVTWISQCSVYRLMLLSFPLMCIWHCLRARPKAERVFAEYENFLKLSDPTDRPTDRPWRFSASYIFWTKLPIDKRFSASESHIQQIIRISIVTLSIQIRTRDRCGKRPMFAPKTNSEPRNLNFSLQKSQQTARFELNSITSF